ncbi:hypothetical protein FGADI_3721 [Fusarium gaditjirri]|uniref:Uncharacterized protein n=1 Tax=Fusarium gaditjirri TaxID=282569 RepID=A0A8H4X0J0_9HYPO|nr:hypothetical protein FGADI_3721 [Fusarium gaditjirri]
MFEDEEFTTSDMDEALEDEDEMEDTPRASRHIYLTSIGVRSLQPINGPRRMDFGIIKLWQRGKLAAYHDKPALERIWVAAAWRLPWIIHSPESIPHISFAETGLVSISSSTAEALGMPQLAALPSGVLQLIGAYSRESLVWNHPAIKSRAEEFSRFDENMPKDDDMQYRLEIVKKWHRGQDADLDENPPKSGVFRVTLDLHGLLDIERLPDWPEYKSCRSRIHKYFFIGSPEAQRTLVYIKFGHARMRLDPSTPRPLQFWDIPSPHTNKLVVLLKPWFTEFSYNRTLDLRNITGITFFYYQGTLMGLHAHTLRAPTAMSTVEDFLSDYGHGLAWITTKLAGDFSIGPNYDPEDQNFLFQGTPTVLVHNTPGKGGITLFGLAGDEPQETLPAPRFRFISLSPDQLTHGGNAISVDVSLKGAVRIHIFKDSVTECLRGFLLDYENGAQRTAGQCRVGVDSVTVCHKPVSFCYRQVRRGGL